jgi:hypothetical protein
VSLPSAGTRLAHVLQPPTAPGGPVPPQRRQTSTKPHIPNQGP